MWPNQTESTGSSAAHAQASAQQAAWLQGLEHEVQFWRNWMASRGGQWPEGYVSRLNPQEPLQEYLRPYVTAKAGGAPFRILDAGSGPLTPIGKVLPGVRLEVTAVDALALMYDRLLSEFGIAPVVRTLPGEFEHLSKIFCPDSFDLVHTCNSIDHCYDPFLGLLSMVSILKPGGHLVVRVWANEGRDAKYEGLHQWNFNATADDLVLSVKDAKKMSLKQAIEPVAEPVRIDVESKGNVPGQPPRALITAVFKKKQGMGSGGFNLTGCFLR